VDTRAVRIAKVVLEIVVFLVLLGVVHWLASVVTGTDSLWPAVTYSACYIGVRTVWWARTAGASGA
jgi:hypothetical protein